MCLWRTDHFQRLWSTRSKSGIILDSLDAGAKLIGANAGMQDGVHGLTRKYSVGLVRRRLESIEFVRRS